MDISNDNIDNLGTRISVEIGTPVKVELEDIEIPMQSSIVGLENDKYIIIKAPEPFKRIKHKLYTGNEMIVRYISGGTVYAFQTKVMETILKPIPLLFIEYPRIIQRHDLREQKRTNCHMPTRIIVGETENIGCIVDMAKFGCRCIVQASKNSKLIKYDLENQITMKSIFPGSKDIVCISGVIKNVKRTKAEYDLGILFTKETPVESQKIISWFISTIEEFA
jgi:c-di-GMP-binding flagellar brake protein YcgR